MKVIKLVNCLCLFDTLRNKRIEFARRTTFHCIFYSYDKLRMKFSIAFTIYKIFLENGELEERRYYSASNLRMIHVHQFNIKTCLILQGTVFCLDFKLNYFLGVKKNSDSLSIKYGRNVSIAISIRESCLQGKKRTHSLSEELSIENIL